MRHDESDERDDADERDRDAGEERDDDDRHEAEALDVEAEVAGVPLPEGEEVVARTEHDGDDHPRDGDRRDDAHLPPQGAVERPELPEDDLLAVRGARREEHEGEAGAGEGVDGDAGEEEGDDLGAAVRAGDDVHEQRRAESAEEREHRDAVVAEGREPERDRDRRAERRARRDADDAGLGERVAEDRLHDRPRGGEGGADDERHDDAREPHDPQRRLDHGVVGRPRVRDPDRPQQRADDLRRGHGELAEQRRQQHARHEECGQGEADDQLAHGVRAPGGATRRCRTSTRRARAPARSRSP